MQITQQVLLPLARQRVWDALQDGAILRAAIPGCETLTDEGEGRYAVGVVAAVGPVRARFKGKLQQHDLEAPRRYALSFEGEGGLAGYVRGSAQVELEDAPLDMERGGEQGANTTHATNATLANGSAMGTLLRYSAQAQIGGRLAQIGSRLIDASAARLSAQFFSQLSEAIAHPPAAQAEAALAQTSARAFPQGADPALARGSAQPPAADVAPSALSAALAASAASSIPIGLPARAVHSSAAAGGCSDMGARGGLSAPVVIQMPAWTWAFTIAVLAALVGWLYA